MARPEPALRLLRSIAELATVPGPIHLAIGVFDGVHRGHQAVIGRALDGARQSHGEAVAVTFDPHPAQLLRPDRAPRLLTSPGHKALILRRLGVRWLLVVPFDHQLAATSPREFVLALHRAARPLREICVGHQWSFGRGREGNLGLLQRLGEEFGFAEVGVPAVTEGGRPISSTLVRHAVAAGELDRAARFLGRPYSILATVVAGQRIGRTLGFPTANLLSQSEQHPPHGVYAVRAELGGRRLPGVANVGIRPTIVGTPDAGRHSIEVHLFDFDGDLYGHELEVFFRGFIRPERRFPDRRQLQAQIAADVVRAKELLAGC